ncbi:hypothetical protein OPV22_005449 [Ensete ventricosum]|uniref:Pectinesterase inhibitor domain-containing protein n=1 Tax=Ensete ventricosum TaxID=4639 RepID=A0AAV8RMN5_ENSVE|nr:hypothetical protein OPV22_005449 [Ensete ventricosum]RWW11172.1 hypothetical protein GW17_00025237 [Ensete ventricosum]RZS05336.1 hypothetical protein BHM03_00035828 [Ensete ventricosum]
MRPNDAFCGLLLILFLALSSLSSATETMEKACNLTIDYHFCMKSLQADPRSHSADLRGLGAIAIDLSIAHANATTSKLETLHANASNPYTKNKLEACLILYRNALPPLQLAAEFLASKHFGVAKAMMEAPVFAPGSCEGLLGRVLATDNDSVFNLMLMARRFAEALE